MEEGKIEEIVEINFEKTKQLEYLLLFENNPLEKNNIYKTLKIGEAELESLVGYCNDNYQKMNSIYKILFLEENIYLSINPNDKSVIEKIRGKKVRKVNKATMEVLSIIAYQQPITRIEIDEIRGVNSSSHIKILLEDGLIDNAGQREILGKPMTYKTTPKFLLYFGIQSLEELPTLEEVKEYEFLE